MSDPLENEKSFYESLDDSLGQFYIDEDDIDGDLYPIQKSLKSSGNRFENESFFASGGIKKVFTVLENSTERKVALARPHESDPQAVESFLKEARRTALLEHANIVRVYDVGVDEKGPWFTMEFISGDSLQQKLTQVSLTDDWDLYERLEVFNKVCDAIAYAHSKGILHLDIKPDNIRLGEYGEILVCDWGLSFLDYAGNTKAELSNNQTIHGMIKGTPGYMAPEQIKGEKSVQSDVFSLGGLFYTLLTYKVPVSGKSTEEILKNTLLGQFEVDSSSKIPARLLPVIQKALEVDLSERYQSVSELHEEIHKYRAGFATSAENPSLLTQIKLFYSRNKSLCSIVVTFLALIIFVTDRHINVIEAKQEELLTEKKKTEEAFELYKSEEKAHNKILDQFSNTLIVQSRFDLDSFNVERSLENLNTALKKDPTNQETLMQLGFVHFIQNNFKLASDYFRRTTFGKVEDLKEIANKLRDNTDLLPAEELIEVFKQLKRSNLHMYMFTYYVKQQTDHNEIVKLTKYMIERRNRLEKFNFKYDRNKKSLDLSNNPKLKSLFSISGTAIKDFCLLRYLYLSHLDVSNTGFKKLEELNRQKLLTLNLKNTPIKSIEYLKSMPSLRKLTLGENQKHLVNSKYHFKIVFE